MKKITFILLSTIVVSTFSCSKFVDLDPVSQQSTNNFYKNPLEIDQALTAAYNALKSVDQYGGNGFSSFMEVRSDNTWNINTTMAGGAYASFDNFNLSSTNIQLDKTWSSCYDAIQRCNIVITRLQGNASIEDNFKKRKIAEAKFIRALTYFNLVRIWGDVPLITTEVTDVNDAFNHTRENSEKVYQQIIEDLKYTITNLPNSYEANDKGRVTKGAGQTLLAKVYLTRQEWQSSLTLLNEIISEGSYQLLDNFSEVFSVTNKNNKESIFEVQFDKTIEGQGYMGGDPLIPGADVNNLPSGNLVKLFENNPDDRKSASIIELNNEWRLYKWHDTKGSNNGMGFNIIVLRYADVLLMASEAMNEIKYGEQKSLDLLNKVRKRSHAQEYTYAELSNQDLFRQAIAKERRLELAFENHRWFDLVRTNKAVEVMNSEKEVSIFKINIKPYQLLYPIPQAQIDASGKKLTQNKGY